MSDCYIGIKPCKCVVAITTGLAYDMASDVAQYIRQGYRVECVTIEEGKARLKRCKCDEIRGQ